MVDKRNCCNLLKTLKKKVDGDMVNVELDPRDDVIKARDKYWDLKFSRKKVSIEDTLEAANEYIEQLERVEHQLACELATHTITHWPRIKDLPEKEREPFRKWLTGQTVPLITSLAYDEQDAYYPWDYKQWKRTLKGEAVLWD